MYDVNYKLHENVSWMEIKYMINFIPRPKVYRDYSYQNNFLDITAFQHRGKPKKKEMQGGTARHPEKYNHMTPTFHRYKQEYTFHL